MVAPFFHIYYFRILAVVNNYVFGAIFVELKILKSVISG